LIRNSRWLGLAAIDAFFSWTEHVFIHLAILQGRLTTGNQVAEVADADWSTKFRAALDLTDHETKAHFDTLVVIRRQMRNFMAHGAFGKQGEGIVHHRLTGRDQPVRERRREFRRRVPRRLPARLDPLLIERLITAAGSWRDKAILTLLCRTGQRIGDWSDINGRHGLLGMALSDVDESRQTITVRLKGARQDHRVPVTDDFWPLFRRYLHAERRTAVDTAAIWVAQRRGHGVPLSYAAFESALRLLGRKVGATVRAHQFRHTVAQGILETSGNLKVAQALLGHAHLSTTADLYLTVDPRALVDAVAAVKTQTDAAAQAQHRFETPRAAYAFAYDALTIEELERAVTATRSPDGERS
jgi:integrase